jgi:peptidoglycan/LPS O-acetylase OafA/YrhL
MQRSESNKTRLKGLDSARGLAIVLVVIFHYLHNSIFSGLANVIIGPFGLGGVTLFFMLSGFLIERHLVSDRNLVRYFSRRLFRILPAYLICLAVILIIDRLTPDSHHWTPREVTLNAVLLQDVLGAPLMLGVIWTLLIEIKFYALAPFVMRAGKIVMRLAPYAAMAANGIVFAYRAEASTFLTYLTFCFVGMHYGPWTRGEMPGLSLIALAIITALATYLFGNYFAAGLAIFVIIDGLIIAIALKWPVAFPMLSFLGRVSYSWYLYHAAIGYPLIAVLTAAMGGHTILVVAITATVTLAAAWISFMIFERPGIAFGQQCEKILLRFLATS